MSMLERVARESFATEYDAHAWDILPYAAARHIKYVQAAIEAMREPTTEMVEAAMRGRDGQLPAAVFRSIWQAAIDAALAEAE